MQMIVVAALLCAAPPIPPPSLDPFLKDVPGVTSAATAPAASKVDGINVIQRSVRSDRTPEELKEYFALAFDKAGFYIPPDQDVLIPQTGLQVTGLDTDNLISYTALLQPSGTKGTTIVLAMANLGKKAPLKDPIAPVYPGGTSVTSYTLENLKAMTYSVSATPAEIKNFYRDSLTTAGFKDGAEANTYVKGHELITLSIAPGLTEQGVLIKIETLTGPQRVRPELPKDLPTEVPKLPKLPKGSPPPPGAKPN